MCGQLRCQGGHDCHWSLLYNLLYLSAKIWNGGRGYKMPGDWLPGQSEGGVGKSIDNPFDISYSVDRSEVNVVCDPGACYQYKSGQIGQRSPEVTPIPSETEPATSIESLDYKRTTGHLPSLEGG